MWAKRGWDRQTEKWRGEIMTSHRHLEANDELRSLNLVRKGIDAKMHYKCIQDSLFHILDVEFNIISMTSVQISHHGDGPRLSSTWLLSSTAPPVWCFVLDNQRQSLPIWYDYFHFETWLVSNACSKNDLQTITKQPRPIIFLMRNSLAASFLAYFCRTDRRRVICHPPFPSTPQTVTMACTQNKTPLYDFETTACGRYVSGWIGLDSIWLSFRILHEIHEITHMYIDLVLIARLSQSLDSLESLLLPTPSLPVVSLNTTTRMKPRRLLPHFPCQMG